MLRFWLFIFFRARMRTAASRISLMILHLAIADLLVTFLLMPLEVSLRGASDCITIFCFPNWVEGRPGNFFYLRLRIGKILLKFKIWNDSEKHINLDLRLIFKKSFFIYFLLIQDLSSSDVLSVTLISRHRYSASELWI